MGAMLKKALSVVAAMLFVAAVQAADVELRPDHPDTYVVKKGDTLWDISGRFLKSPWYWPEIWQANPQIENPHLIYPGDVISLVYIDGKPQLVVSSSTTVSNEPAPDIGPKVRGEEDDNAIPPLPLSAVREFLSRPRMLTEEEYKAAPYIVGLEEDQIISPDRQLAYVRQLGADVKPRERFVIARPTLKYSDVPDGWMWSKDKRRVKAQPWEVADQWHWSFREWVSNRGAEVLGFELLEVGNATISVTGDPATAYISYVDVEIRKGDILLPIEEAPFDMNYYPRAPKSVPDNMRVLAYTNGYERAGPNEVVVLSKGAQDGLENGEVYSIYQPGITIQDEVSYPKHTMREFFNPKDKMVKMPEEFIGHVMIFRTFDRVSYGLVMNAVRPVELGAILHEPTEL